MADLLEKIPPEARWQIAAKGLTGAHSASSNALKQAVGEAKFNELNGEIWYQAGKGVKQFIDAFGLPVGDATQIMETIVLAARVLVGPEVEVEVVEATQDRCVTRVSKCAWHERRKEQGINWDFCTVGHQKWNDGILESINPNFTASFTKTMPAGAPCCEVIIERKK